MKRLIILVLLGASSLGGGPLTGCSWDFEGEEFRFWLFQPELLEARSLHPFYFTTDVLNATDDAVLLEVGYEANVAEWKAVVGDDVPEEAIRDVLYGTSPLYFWKHEAELFKENAFLSRLHVLKHGWPEFIRYAKTCEELVNASDPWGFDEHDVAGIDKAWTAGLKQLRNARDPKLKARITYQLVRLAYYNGCNPAMLKSANAAYQKHLLPLRGTTWLEPSAAFYLASALPNPERDLAYAKVFNRATDKQFRMVQLFGKDSAESYLPLADDDRHRAAILVMRCLQHPGRALGELERIAAWDPGNEHLPLLVSREVNKLEDWLLTPDLTDLGSAINYWNGLPEGVSQTDVLKADLAYLHEVKAFIAGIMPQFPEKDGVLLRLLDGHLSLVAGDMDECRKLLGSVMDNKAASGKVRVQAHVDNLLAQVMAHELNDDAQADILALVELINTEPELEQTRGLLLDQLHLYLGKKLIERGDLAEGLFLLARSERTYGHMVAWWGMNARHVAYYQAKPADYDRMIALLDKPQKTAFEQYLTGTNDEPEGWQRTNERIAQTDLSRNRLLDYKATWYMNADSVEHAAAVFKQIPDEFWTGFPYAMFAADDPFVVDIWDPHNYEKRDSVRYNKRTIVERMVALKKEADRNPKKRALNNYLLGNAYFNMTWHGKYWIMSRISWSIWETSEYWNRGDPLADDTDYYECGRALEHYLIAIEEAKDPVLKAMAVRMAGECESNRLNYAADSGTPEWQNPWVEELTDERSQEAYRAIEDCSGYADFVRRFR